MSTRFWKTVRADREATGTTWITNTTSFNLNVGERALRRSILNLWFEVINPDADEETDLGNLGVEWCVVLVPFSEDPPAPGTFPPGPDLATNDRFIMWGAGPGEHYRTTETGVHQYRYPSGGGAFHVDTVTNRVFPPGGAFDYVPWLSWSFGPFPGAWTDVTRLVARARMLMLVERP